MASSFLIAFLIYLMLMIGFGWWMARANRDGDDFLLCGRSLPWLLTLGTTVATMVGTGSSMGAVGKAYAGGWSGALFGAGGAVGIFLLAWLFAPVRQWRFSSMGEELACCVGGSAAVRNLVSVFVVLSSIGWLGAHILGGARYLQFVTGIDLNISRVLIAAGFGIYVILGGYRAVVWTDSLQALVLFTGFIITAIIAVSQLGGLEQLQAAQRDIVQTNGSPAVLPSLSLVVAIAVGILGTPSFRQRIYSGKNVASIRRAFVISGVLYLAFAILPAIIGICAHAHNPDLESRDLAFPMMAMETLPLWAGIMVLIAGLSATMSSASSDAIASVTSILQDLHLTFRGRYPAQEKIVPLSRIALTSTIAFALGMTLLADNIIGYIETVIVLFMSGMATAAVMGRIWPRYNASGAIATLIAAFVVALVVRMIPEWNSFWGNPTLPAVGLSATAGVLASLVTPPEELTHDQCVRAVSATRSTQGDNDS